MAKQVPIQREAAAAFLITQLHSAILRKKKIKFTSAQAHQKCWESALLNTRLLTTGRKGGLPEEKPEKISQLDTRCRCYSRNNERLPFPVDIRRPFSFRNLDSKKPDLEMTKQAGPERVAGG